MDSIEVFADIWCPFAHAGLRAVVARRDELGRGDVALRIRAWPLELVNGQPEDPAVTAKHIADIKELAAPDLFAGFDADTFPRTTLPALSLAAAAYRAGDEVGERVSLALRDALFERGRDVSDEAELRVIAEANGVREWSLDDAAVRADWEAGKARGVQGSPHFFCGSTSAFCPSLQIEDEGDGHLDVRPTLGRMEEFLSSCLG